MCSTLPKLTLYGLQSKLCVKQSDIRRKVWCILSLANVYHPPPYLQHKRFHFLIPNHNKGVLHTSMICETLPSYSYLVWFMTWFEYNVSSLRILLMCRKCLQVHFRPDPPTLDDLLRDALLTFYAVKGCPAPPFCTGINYLSLQLLPPRPSFIPASDHRGQTFSLHSLSVKAGLLYTYQ